MTSDRNIIIIGAGPGGMACAHRLVERGYRVTVLEAEDSVGGLSRTVERDGFRFDLGGHRWFTKNPELQSWFTRLMDGNLVEVQRTSRILFDGKYFEYPIRIGNVLKSAGLWVSFRCMLNYMRSIAAGALRPADIETMEGAYIAQFGRRLYEMFFRRYSEKVWGRPCSELSADWVTQRTSGLSIWTAGVNALFQSRSKSRTLLERFLYPRLGFQQISDRMRLGIEAGGGEIMLGAAVREVDHGDPGQVVVRYEQKGTSRELIGDRVVSTIPLPQLLSSALVPRPPPELVDAARSLEFRSLICVNLMIDRPRMTRDTWIYCHDEGIRFARLHEPRNWSPELAPEGKTSAVLEFFCQRGDATHSLDDEELIELGTEGLIRLGLVTRQEIIGGFVVRADEAYPIYAVGYMDALKKMLAHIAAIERLSVIGRGGTFRYNNCDHSIEMGLSMAQIIEGNGDETEVLRINSSPEYGEEDVITSPTPYR